MLLMRLRAPLADAVAATAAAVIAASRCCISCASACGEHHCRAAGSGRAPQRVSQPLTALPKLGRLPAAAAAAPPGAFVIIFSAAAGRYQIHRRGAKRPVGRVLLLIASIIIIGNGVIIMPRLEIGRAHV